MLFRTAVVVLCLVEGGRISLLCDTASLTWKERQNYRAAPVSFSGRHRGPGFERVPRKRTNVHFVNHLSLSSRLVNQILLNGSGVAAGDINGDGRTDIYFCGLERANRLYLNRGNWQFDVVGKGTSICCAGQYSTGAVFADLDGDGDLDLLVSSIANGVRCFINDGQGDFTEKPGFIESPEPHGSMSMTLADIDKDGDLDLYVANYRPTTFRDRPDASVRVKIRNGEPEVTSVEGMSESPEALRKRFEVDRRGELIENGEPDWLYLNDGKGRFRRVSWTGGRFRDSQREPLEHPPHDWGLSARFHDINGDHAPDLYVCNDFHSPDRIWINDGKGQFRASEIKAFAYTPLYSMGTDIADINNDGHPDIFVADMLSRHHHQRMVQVGQPTAYRESRSQANLRGRAQYMRNMLYLNRGDGTFAEIAHFSRVAASGWSWSPLFMDVNLDGYQDLLITTGHERDILDADIRSKIETIKARDKPSARQQLLLRRRYPRLNLPNVAFRNNGNLTFDEVSREWNFADRGITHGIASADLDNDGDLDLVMNRLNDTALLSRNTATAPRVAVRLQGRSPNTYGVGARISVYGGPCVQTSEISCGGNYLSSNSLTETFAVGDSPDSDLRIRVLWPDGEETRIKNAKSNRYYEIHQE